MNYAKLICSFDFKKLYAGLMHNKEKKEADLVDVCFIDS